MLPCTLTEAVPGRRRGGGEEGLRELLFLLFISSLLCDLWTDDNKLTEKQDKKEDNQ